MLPHEPGFMAYAWKSFRLWKAWLCCWTLDNPWPLSLRGWLLKDGGQLWHQLGQFGALNQLPQHNPIQRRGQSIQCSLSLIITYRQHWRRSRSSSQASEVCWWLILWLQKNAIWDGKLYCIDQTNQTLIWWLSALIPSHFSSFWFLSLYFCFVFPSLTLFFPFSLGFPSYPKNRPGSNGGMATRWWLGARLAPVGPTAFLYFPCSPLPLMQRTPLKVLYKVQRARTTTIEIWDERSAAVINHLSINHCHPCCFAHPIGQPMAPWELENAIC